MVCRMNHRQASHVSEITARKLNRRLTQRRDCVQSVADLDLSREIFPRVTLLGAHNPKSRNSAVWRAAPRSSHALCRILTTLAAVIIPRIEEEGRGSRGYGKS